MIKKPAIGGDDLQEEITKLVRQLHETQTRLRELTGGEVDAVLHPGGHSYLLHEAQEQLQQSEATQRQVAETQVAILNALPAHIALVDARGTILSTNEAWRRFATANSLHGPEFAVGENYLKVCERAKGDCSKEAKATAAGIRGVLKNETPDFTMEYPCHSPTEERWFLLRVTPVHENQSAGAVVMHINITERKLAEGQLRLREEQLRLYTEYSPAAIAMFDREMKYLVVSRGWMEAYHLGDRSIIGLSHYEVFPEVPPRWKEIHRRCLEGAVEKCEEDPFPRADGTESWLRWEVRPWRQSDGTVGGIVMFSEDITKRKQAEDARRTAESRFRLLVDSNAQGVIFWNTKGEIKGANDAFLKLVQYTREDLEKGLINWMALTPPEYAHLDRRAIEQMAATGTCELYEKEYLLKDGTRVPILLGAATFKDDPTEGVCFVLDLSERKKLEQQFLRAQRMESIGTLAGGIAHDLNNVLAPIMLSIDLLKMRYTTPSDKELLATLSSSAHRGADMVRQVLSFARGVEGRHMEVQALHVIRDVEKIASDTFSKHIHVRTIAAQDLWTIMGDPTQVHQVLLNLCVNARDAMPDGGTLTLSAENVQVDEHYAGLITEAKPGPHLLLQVEDTGSGMPAGLIEKIFDPFFTTKEIGKGTGLGLSTSLAIVKSHGGFIRVYSELGKGTKFKIYFPARTEPSSDAAMEIAAEMPRGSGELILVVDDEVTVRQITQQTLQAFGYRVVLAADGADALSIFAKQGPEIAVVLTDMMMPVMDGPALIRVLRKMNPLLPIIGASGLTATNQVSQSGSLGITHFLPKPYMANDLLKILREILSAPGKA